MPVFSLHEAGDIRAHHKGCVAGVTSQGRDVSCMGHRFLSKAAFELGKLGSGSWAAVENENGSG